jgi:hypothetical protein
MSDNNVYVVKHCLAEDSTENAICHIASTLGKAMGWCKNSDKKWLMIFEQTLDEDITNKPALVMFDYEGNPIEEKLGKSTSAVTPKKKKKPANGKVSFQL